MGNNQKVRVNLAGNDEKIFTLYQILLSIPAYRTILVELCCCSLVP
jgi:hypothetical protein